MPLFLMKGMKVATEGEMSEGVWKEGGKVRQRWRDTSGELAR